MESLKSGYSIVVQSKISLAKNNTNYATITVQNETSKHTINIWAVGKTNPFKLGFLVKFNNLTNKDGFLSAKFTDVELVHCPEDNPLRRFLPTPTTKLQWDALKNNICSILTDEKEIGFILNWFDRLYTPYSNKPAARTNHHAYPGGLLTHTYELINQFFYLRQALAFNVDPFVVVVACLFHDFGKLSEYDADSNYTPHFFLKGHPFMGAEAVGTALRDYKFDDNLVSHIQHCVLAHHGRLEWGAPVLPASPEAFLVAKLDEISGHGIMFADAEDGQSVNGTKVYHYKK